MKRSALKTIAVAGSFLALGTLVASEALAQRGSRGGGGRSTSMSRGGSGSFSRGTPSRDMQVRSSSRSNINYGGNRTNTKDVNRNRDVNRNVNRDVNVDRDYNVDIDVDHDYDWGDHYHPVARAAAVTAAAVTTAAVVGSYYRTLPANCVTIYRGAVVYYQCGTVWYQPSYYGTTVQYVVVTAP